MEYVFSTRANEKSNQNKVVKVWKAKTPDSSNLLHENEEKKFCFPS